MQTILVTGGAGYIGSHTCKALKAAGFTPVVYDNLNTGREELVKYGPFIKGDIRDIPTLSAAIAQYKPAAVMHFAALLAVGESVTSPATYDNNNVHGSWCILEAMRQNNINTIIFSSTAAVYGIPENPENITEDLPKNPINPYGRTKLAVEGMLADYSHAYGLRYAALRYFNAAGADPDGEVGYLYPTPTNLVPVAVNVLAGQQPSLNIFGTDYPTPDGTCIRDYIHVTDLATAHVKALQHLLGGGQSGAFNLGTNKGSSVLEVVHALEEASGKKIPTTLSPRRAGDPAMLVANANKAMQTFNWQPTHSSLDEIARTAWAWRHKQA